MHQNRQIMSPEASWRRLEGDGGVTRPVVIPTIGEAWESGSPTAR